MSFNLTGSAYNQALQVQKTIKLGGYKNPEKTKLTAVYTNSYESAKIDPRPKSPEVHNLDFLC